MGARLLFLQPQLSLHDSIGHELVRVKPLAITTHTRWCSHHKKLYSRIQTAHKTLKLFTTRKRQVSYATETILHFMQLFCSRRRFLLDVMQLIPKLDVRVNVAKPRAQQSTKFVPSALRCRQRLHSSMHVVSSCSCEEQGSISPQIRSYVAQL